MKRLSQTPRRGAITVLAAVFIVVMLAMIALAVDVGYLSAVRTQLQTTADAAALAAASRIGENDMVAVAQDCVSRNQVAGRAAQLAAADAETGVWDNDSRTFTPSTTMINAVRATVRTGANYGGSTGLFFARIFGISSVDQKASAIATVNPRDICFVVDLSGSMNDDTEPYDSGGSSTRVQNIYTDFGFGTCPGTLTTMQSGTTNRLKQLASAMPVALNSFGTNNTTYWNSYFSYLSNKGYKLGYYTYVQYMMDYGRTKLSNGYYTPLAVGNTASCPYHLETTDAGDMYFPPREMPTHACRRAIIAALQVVKNRNSAITNSNQRDWVSLVAFDYKNTSSDTSHVRIVKTLTDDYAAVIDACRTLQACDDDGSCTDTEGGLLMAKNHIKAESEGGAGRENVNKIVVLLTDGVPNLYESSTSTINAYMAANAGGWGSSYAQNASLMQSSIIQGDKWFLYAVGVGTGADQTFLDRMAVKAGTATDDKGFTTASDAATYEATLRTIFSQIITRPKLRLVQ
jgi:Mg-chelatase subunit ChlD